MKPEQAVSERTGNEWVTVVTRGGDGPAEPTARASGGSRKVVIT